MRFESGGCTGLEVGFVAVWLWPGFLGEMRGFGTWGRLWEESRMLCGFGRGVCGYRSEG